MQVIVTRKAQKQFSSIPQSSQSKIKKRLNVLEEDPTAGKKLIGKLTGLRSLRAWPYRIIYLVDEKEEKVWIVSILHRQGAYR